MENKDSRRCLIDCGSSYFLKEDSVYICSNNVYVCEYSSDDS